MFFNSPLLAVDIGSSAIKVVELSGKGDKTLSGVGIELLPPGIVQNGTINDPTSVVQGLKRLMKRMRLRSRGRRAALSLGGSSVIIKKAAFPTGDNPGALSETIYYEAEQHFQHDINDLYFDYHQLETIADAREAEVILVGAKRETVEQHMSIVKSCGMKVGVVDGDVFALANMFEFNYGMIEGLIALINIGATVTQVSMVGNGQYLYTRDVPIAGEHYSRAIAEQLNIAFENAESLKIAASMGDGAIRPEVEKIIKDVNEHLVSEIQMTIDFFFKNGDAPLQFKAASSIFLAGGGSKTLGLDAALAAAMQTPVSIVNPFHKIKIPKRFPMDQLLMQGHLYGIAVGLAQRDFEVAV